MQVRNKQNLNRCFNTSTLHPQAPTVLREKRARTLARCAPCTNTPPQSLGRTSHSAPPQTRAPECRTSNISAGHALSMPAQGLPPNLRLHRAYPRAAAPATSPNNAAPLDTPRSALAAGVDTPHPAALGNCQLRVSQACQWPHSQSRPKLKLQKLRAVVNYNAMAATRIESLQTPNKSGL